MKARGILWMENRESILYVLFGAIHFFPIPWNLVLNASFHMNTDKVPSGITYARRCILDPSYDFHFFV